MTSTIFARCSRVFGSRTSRMLRTALALIFITLSYPCTAQVTSYPLNLQSRSVPGGIELLFNISWSAAAQISRSPDWSADQQFIRFFLFTDTTAPQQPPGGGVDPFVSAGRNYTYVVSTPFETKTVKITYQPVCTFIGICPIAAGAPPTYTVNCKSSVDFYTADKQLPPASAGQSSFSGVATVFPTNAVTSACLPGTINSIDHGGFCDEFPQTVNVNSCHVPPLPPPTPINSCAACTDSGRVCVKSGSGYVCKGNAK